MTDKGIRIYLEYNSILDEESFKYIRGSKILHMVGWETCYNNLLNLIYSMLKVSRDVYDVKIKILLSMSPTSKFIHNIDGNDNLKLESSF